MSMVIKVICNVMIALILISCKGDKRDVQLEEMGNYMLSNIAQSEGFSLPPYYLLKDIAGKTHRMDSVFKRPKLVFRFSESNSDMCIQTEIEQINDMALNNHIIGLASYDNIRIMKLIQKKYGISFPVYFIPFADKMMLSNSKEEDSAPYLFWIDENLHAKYLFTPSLQYSDVSKAYLSYFSNMLIKNNSSHDNIFSLKNKDLGTIVKGRKYKVEFEYSNNTGDGLVINDVKTSCDCMVSRWEKKPLSAHESARLIVEFTPKTLGYNSKTIIVFHNKSMDPIQLMIRANVEAG